MAYIVNQDIVDRVGNSRAVELTTDSGAVVDNDVLDDVREAAEGEVDGYLARRYATPIDLTAHPQAAATLRTYTLDIAEYRLNARREPPTETDRKMRDDAIKWLEKVGKGEVVLPADVPPATTTADEPQADWGSQTPNASKIRESW